MAKVYVVMGQTGEYSDRNEWPVVAFKSEANAAERVAALDVWLRENKVHWDNKTSYSDVYFGDSKEKKPALDPNFSCDYTGTKYYIMAVDIAD